LPIIIKHLRKGQATTDHDYADAQRRGNGVSLFVMETTGAFSTSLDRALRALGKAARRLGPERDHTKYGVSRASTREFYAHHAAAISASAVYSDVAYVLDAAASMSFLLTLGLRSATTP
jgi:putative aminopeptidase FrvX